MAGLSSEFEDCRHLTGLVAPTCPPNSAKSDYLPSSDSCLFRRLQSLDEASNNLEQATEQLDACLKCYIDNGRSLDTRLWQRIAAFSVKPGTEALVYRLVYHNGIEPKIRDQVIKLKSIFFKKLKLKGKD